MTGWYAFQLVFDIVVCVLVILFVLRDARNRKNSPDLAGLKGLVDEFKKAVERSEKAAVNLDAKLKNLEAAKSATAERILEPSARGNGGPHPAHPRPAGIEEKKQKVGAMHRKGLSKGEISRQLGIPLPEVELIIAMLPSDD